MRNIYLVLLGLTWLLYSCSDITEINDVNLETIDAEFAVPLFSGSFSAVDINDEDGNSFIQIDENDLVTAFYEGELLQQGVNEVFPPFPFNQIIPVLDTNFIIPIDFDLNFTIDRSTFKDSNIFLTFRNNFLEPLTLNVKLPDLKLDGVVFEEEFVLLPGQRIETGALSIDNYELFVNFDDIRITYDARKINGERVVLNEFFFRLDWLSFSYAEGIFDSRVYDIKADLLPIGLFDNWESGGVDFSNPKVNLSVDNAFGFPVRTVVNQLDLVTLTDEVLPLESEFIESGIDFEYPRLDEVGEIKTTNFAFTKENSNLGVIFNQRVKQILFDIDALAFPDGLDNPIKGFVTDSSFFSVNVSVELPVIGSLDDLVLSETFDYDLGDTASEVKSAEFKLVVQNNLPIEVDLQAIFVDNDGVEVLNLFEDGPISLPADSQEQSIIIPFDESKTEMIRLLENVKIRATLNSPDGAGNNGEVILRSTNTLDVRMGAKLKLRR